jgi:hypothetical protein
MFHFGTTGGPTAAAGGEHGRAGLAAIGQPRVQTGMKHKTIQVLFAYWNEVRAGRIAPRRLEIEPSRIAGVLPETFMLERMDASTYHYRLAGTRLCEIFGAELRGLNFLDGWSHGDRVALERHFTSMHAQGAVALLTIEASADTAKRVQLEAILLPLMHSDGMSRVIGTATTTASPHWLGHERLREKRIVRHELIWPDGRPHGVVERAGRQAPFLPEGQEARIVRDERRLFRVLDGGRED